jgi:hypothetical protein
MECRINRLLGHMSKRQKDPSSELITSDSGAGQPDDGSSILPVSTVRKLESSFNQFAEMLYDLSKSNANRHGTSTVTDADVDDAFRELTRPTYKNYVPICLGEAMMIIGGALLGSLVFNYAGIGVLFAIVGIYLRECVSEK